MNFTRKNNEYYTKDTISFEYIDDPKKIREIILANFDTELWDYDLKIGDIEENLKSGVHYIEFTKDDKTCALVKILPDSENVDVSLEILEVAESYGRSRGLGGEIVKFLCSTLYQGTYLYGYSIPQAAKFWKKVASEYNERVYDKIESCEFEGGGLMYFELPSV